MIIKKKQLEGLSLDRLPDAPDGSRIAVSNGTQIFYGAKKFIDGARAARDPAKQNKTLIVKADVDELITSLPTDKIELITLDAQHLTDKGVALSYSVPSGQEENVQFHVGDSDWFVGAGSFRFSVTGNVLSWNDVAYTTGKLKAGDTLHIHYMGEGTVIQTAVDGGHHI